MSKPPRCTSARCMNQTAGYTGYVRCQKPEGHSSPEHLFVSLRKKRIIWTGNDLPGLYKNPPLGVDVDGKFWPEAGEGCKCWVNPDPFTYFGITEPGDALSPNPECPKHFPQNVREREKWRGQEIGLAIVDEVQMMKEPMEETSASLIQKAVNALEDTSLSIQNRSQKAKLYTEMAAVLAVTEKEAVALAAVQDRNEIEDLVRQLSRTFPAVKKFLQIKGLDARFS